MRSIVSLVFLLLSAASVAAQTDQQTGWVEFAPEGGGFSVLLPPSKPIETVTKASIYTLHSFSVTAGRGMYVATYSDYTPDPKRDPATFLAANRDKFNKRLQATLISSREITLDGHAGLEFTSETPAAKIKSQLFLVGDRMFQTATMILKDEDQSKYVELFFKSFKISYGSTPKTEIKP